jgi:hypothetical protein
VECTVSIGFFSDSFSSCMGIVLSTSSGSLMALLLFFFLYTGVSSFLIIGSSKSFIEVSYFLSKGLLIPLPLPFCTGASCFYSTGFSMPLPFFF